MKKCCAHEYYPRRFFWSCFFTKLDPSEKSEFVIREIKPVRKLNLVRYKFCLKGNLIDFYNLHVWQTFFMLT